MLVKLIHELLSHIHGDDWLFACGKVIHRGVRDLTTLRFAPQLEFTDRERPVSLAIGLALFAVVVERSDDRL